MKLYYANYESESIKLDYYPERSHCDPPLFDTYESAANWLVQVADRQLGEAEEEASTSVRLAEAKAARMRTLQIVDDGDEGKK